LTDTTTSGQAIIPLARGGLIPYFVLAYGFTWSFHFAIPLLGWEFSLNKVGPASLYMIGLLGPLFGAVVVTAHAGGRDAVKTLLASALQWRFPFRWYAVALFTFPLVSFSAIVYFERGLLFNPLAYLTFPVAALVAQLWVVIGEEYGWRGYALPRMQTRLGSLGASLLLGVLWAGWHLPMFFVPGSMQYAESFLPSYALYNVFTITTTILMTVLYNRSWGSVLPCMLLHASLNATAFSVTIPSEVAGPQPLIGLILIAAIYLLPRPFFGAGGNVARENAD